MSAIITYTIRIYSIIQRFRLKQYFSLWFFCCSFRASWRYSGVTQDLHSWITPGSSGRPFGMLDVELSSAKGNANATHYSSTPASSLCSLTDPTKKWVLKSKGKENL